MKPNGADVLDYAIVGGGVAGTYVAWRITEASRPGLPRLCVFEAATREGGRLVSADMPGMPYIAELGGMRFIENHLILSRLAKHLGFKTSKFIFDRKMLHLRCGRVDEKNLRYHLTAAPVNPDEDPTQPVSYMKRAIVKALSRMDFDESAPMAACNAIRTKVSDILTQNQDLAYDTFTLAEWDIIKRFSWLKGQPLYRSGFWNLLHHYFHSWEEFSFVRDALGYHSIFENWNAAEAIPWFLRDFANEYSRLDGGMDQLPVRLAFQVQNRLSDRDFKSFSFQSHVRSIAMIWCPEAGVPLFELTYRDRANKRTKTVRARRVVLALPKAALKKIKLSGFDAKRIKAWEQNLRSVRGHALFKLFLGYENAWWLKDLPGTSADAPSGRAVTDMPLRQVFYFGADNSYDRKTGLPDTNTSMAMVMAGYSDATFVDFWRPAHRSQSGSGNDLLPYYVKKDELELDENALQLLRTFGATERMVRKAQSQLEVMHPKLHEKKAIPDPLVALEKEWPAGWHSWQPHCRSWEVMNFLKRPFGANVELFTCGEAFSCDQGWIEGALRSAELALSEMKIPRPRWLETSGEPLHEDPPVNWDDYIGKL